MVTAFFFFDAVKVRAQADASFVSFESRRVVVQSTDSSLICDPVLDARDHYALASAALERTHFNYLAL